MSQFVPYFEMLEVEPPEPIPTRLYAEEARLWWQCAVDMSKAGDREMSAGCVVHAHRLNDVLRRIEWAPRGTRRTEAEAA